TSITYFNNNLGLFQGTENLYKIIYSASCENMLIDLSLHNSWKWYQNGNGPYAISEIPSLSQGEQGLLIREDHSEEKDNWGDLDNSGNSNPLGSGVVSSYGAMQRLYNPNSGEHFYTGDANERNHLVSIGWKDEGIAWQAPETSTTPVYRLYSSILEDHHYTTDSNEKDALTKLGWKYEGISWYSDDQKGTPLYRLYNKNAKKAGSHHYTTNKGEADALVSQGWKDEGIAWYGLYSNSSTTDPSSSTPTATDSFNFMGTYVSSNESFHEIEGLTESIKVDENNHFTGFVQQIGPGVPKDTMYYSSWSGDIVNIQKRQDKKYSGRIANVKREEVDPNWLASGNLTKVEFKSSSINNGDSISIYLAGYPVDKMDSASTYWLRLLRLEYTNLPGTYIVNTTTGRGYCSWLANQDSSTPSQGSQTPTNNSVKEKYKVNYIMKVRSQPNYEGTQIGRKEEGSIVEIVKTVSGSNRSIWGQLVDGGWICLKDADLVYATKIG
ncbi:MAG: hypothetical protein K2H85_06180, partial [Allobaculum sp.]|nr:hypothetical protein [Allobaculum sp.]